MDSAFKRHKIVYTILRPLVVLYCKIVFNYKVEKPVDMEGPFILIPNHVSVTICFLQLSILSRICIL